MKKFVFTILGAIVLLSFTLINKSETKKEFFTVVIDAGHGGKDAGATSVADSINEKDLTLAISEKIKLLNSDKKLKLIFTRSTDEFISLAQRPALASTENADLFISLHISVSSSENMSGVQIYYPKDNQFTENSKVYSNVFLERFANNISELQEHPVQPASFIVLKKAPCPSLLLEVGYLSNATDKAFLAKEKNQYFIAQTIIEAIEEIKEN